MPNMAYCPSQKVGVHAVYAVCSALEREPFVGRRLEHLDFIDIYADLTDNAPSIDQQRDPAMAEAMSRFEARFLEQGMQQGEARVLLGQLTRRFGQFPAATSTRSEPPTPIPTSTGLNAC